MSSFLNMLKSRLQSDNEDDVSNYSRSGMDYGESHVRTQTVKSTAHSAARCGLYASPKRRSTKQQRCDSHLGHYKQLDRLSKGDDPNDPIIKHSMYPQMIGKRRSELEAQIHTRNTMHDRASTEEQHREDTAPVGRKVYRSHTMRRVRPRSVDSDPSSPPDYSSDENSEARPIRVCIYPQAKYIKEPVKILFNPQRPLEGYSSDSSSVNLALRTPSFRNWKRSSLPGDEYQSLRRRQVMQRAREVLEQHYAHRRSAKIGLIGHGQTQSFTKYHSERRRDSRMQYAVRKALQADLNVFGDYFMLAMSRHARKVYFCELSDINGMPIDEKLMWGFIRMYRKARDEAYKSEDSKEPVNQPLKHVHHAGIEARDGWIR